MIQYGRYGDYVNVDWLPEYYEEVGAELSVAAAGSGSYDFKIDATAEDESAAVYVGLYDEADNLVEMKKADEAERTLVADETMTRILGDVHFETETAVRYAKAFVWDSAMRPLTASAAVYVDEPDISVSKSDGETVINVNEKAESVSLYGPMLAYSAETENCRYFRDFEDESAVDGNKITLTVKGDYMIAVRDEKGIEKKKFVSVE